MRSLFAGGLKSSCVHLSLLIVNYVKINVKNRSGLVLTIIGLARVYD